MPSKISYLEIFKGMFFRRVKENLRDFNNGVNPSSLQSYAINKNCYLLMHYIISLFNLFI